MEDLPFLDNPFENEEFNFEELNELNVNSSFTTPNLCCNNQEINKEAMPYQTNNKLTREEFECFDDVVFESFVMENSKTFFFDKTKMEDDENQQEREYCLFSEINFTKLLDIFLSYIKESFYIYQYKPYHYINDIDYQNIENNIKSKIQTGEMLPNCSLNSKFKEIKKISAVDVIEFSYSEFISKCNLWDSKDATNKSILLSMDYIKRYVIQKIITKFPNFFQKKVLFDVNNHFVEINVLPINNNNQTVDYKLLKELYITPEMNGKVIFFNLISFHNIIKDAKFIFNNQGYQGNFHPDYFVYIFSSSHEPKKFKKKKSSFTMDVLKKVKKTSKKEKVVNFKDSQIPAFIIGRNNTPINVNNFKKRKYSFFNNYEGEKEETQLKRRKF